jgi:hypothetical protein
MARKSISVWSWSLRKAGPVVVAQRQPRGDGVLDRAEALGAGLCEQVGGGPAVLRGAASIHASPVAWSTIANTAQRPSARVCASVASVAHSVSGTLTVMVPSCTRRERLADLRRGGKQAGLAREPQHPLAAGAHAPQAQAGRDLVASPTNGDSWISRRIAASSAGSQASDRVCWARAASVPHLVGRPRRSLA